MLTDEEAQFLRAVNGSNIWWYADQCCLCDYQLKNPPGSGVARRREQEAHEIGHARAIPAEKRAMLLSALALGSMWVHAIQQVFGIQAPGYPTSSHPGWLAFWKEHGGCE